MTRPCPLEGLPDPGRRSFLRACAGWSLAMAIGPAITARAGAHAAAAAPLADAALARARRLARRVRAAHPGDCRQPRAWLHARLGSDPRVAPAGALAAAAREDFALGRTWVLGGTAYSRTECQLAVWLEAGQGSSVRAARTGSPRSRPRRSRRGTRDGR